MASELPQGAISPIEWRATGIKYTNNEFYLDIVESLDCIIDKYAFLFFLVVSSHMLQFISSCIGKDYRGDSCELSVVRNARFAVSLHRSICVRWMLVCFQDIQPMFMIIQIPSLCALCSLRAWSCHFICSSRWAVQVDELQVVWVACSLYINIHRSNRNADLPIYVRPQFSWFSDSGKVGFFH